MQVQRRTAANTPATCRGAHRQPAPRPGQVIATSTTVSLCACGNDHRRTAEPAVPKARLYTPSYRQWRDDTSDPQGAHPAFTSNNDRDRITTYQRAAASNRARGPTAEGAGPPRCRRRNLWKIRMPLPRPTPDEAMPKELQELAAICASTTSDAGDWWESRAYRPAGSTKALRQILLRHLQQMAFVDPAAGCIGHEAIRPSRRNRQQVPKRDFSPALSPLPCFASSGVLCGSLLLCQNPDRMDGMHLVLARTGVAPRRRHVALRAGPAIDDLLPHRSVVVQEPGAPPPVGPSGRMNGSSLKTGLLEWVQNALRARPAPGSPRSDREFPVLPSPSITSRKAI